MPKMISGGTVVTMDQEQRVLDNAAVIWSEDRIIWIGLKEQIPLEYHGIDDFDGHGKIILPGFINLHTHVTLSVLRGVGDDKGIAPAYSPNVPQGVFLSPSECYLFSLLGGLEALRFGSTCIVDNYIHEEETAKAFFELGVRAVISERLHDSDLFRIPEGIYEFDDERGEKLLEKNLDLISKWNGNETSRISCRLGPHAPDTCSTEYLEKVRDVAIEEDVGLVIHLAQSKREIQEIFNRSGKSPTAYLTNLNLLTPQMIAGHCVYVTEDDIKDLAQTGTQVSHQSYSNAKEGMIAPLNRFITERINVGLGTDNMSGDMNEVMRMALCVARMQTHDPNALRASDVLEMATMGGARALGMQNEIGSLEVGKKADIITIDFEKPHFYPVVDPIANLVHNGLGNDVDSVFVDGELLVENGRCLTIDTPYLLSKVQELSNSLWEKVDRS